MSSMKWLLLTVFASLLAACGGGGSAGTPLFGSGSGSGTSGGTSSSGASLVLSISSTTATAANPSTVTATLHSTAGASVAGQVVTFSTAGGLGAFNVSSALTNANGQAVVQLSPASWREVERSGQATHCPPCQAP